jgi:hypothetical protein
MYEVDCPSPFKKKACLSLEIAIFIFTFIKTKDRRQPLAFLDDSLLELLE